MKIALLTQYYKPEIGAPPNRLYEMVAGLNAIGNEVCVITGMPNYPTGRIFDAYRGKFSCLETLDGIEVKRFWLYASNTKRILPRIWNMLSFSLTTLFSLSYLRRRRIDFLIVESPPLTLGLSGWLLSKMAGARLVLNVSDLWPLSARELGAIRGDSLVYRLLEKIECFLYRRSLFCMGQSVEIVNYISEHGARNIYLFRNGVDPSRFRRTPIARKDRTYKIVYVGLLGFAQGIADVCRNINFAALGVEFHIYGAGGEQEEIESYITQHPDRGIYFHGSVHRDMVPDILYDADTTLIPLVKNIFGAVPSKIYESMAAGLPIIFSGEGEGQMIIEENNLGWVSPSRDYSAMIDNINYFIEHREDVAVKRANCIRCADEKFNRPKQIAALNAFLESKLL